MLIPLRWRFFCNKIQSWSDRQTDVDKIVVVLQVKTADHYFLSEMQQQTNIKFRKLSVNVSVCFKREFMWRNESRKLQSSEWENINVGIQNTEYKINAFMSIKEKCFNVIIDLKLKSQRFWLLLPFGETSGNESREKLSSQNLTNGLYPGRFRPADVTFASI